MLAMGTIFTVITPLIRTCCCVTPVFDSACASIYLSSPSQHRFHILRDANDCLREEEEYSAHTKLIVDPKQKPLVKQTSSLEQQTLSWDEWQLTQ